MAKRARGEGTIIQDKERGGFRAVLSLGFKDGKRLRKIFRASTQAEVLEKLEQARAELRKAQQLGLPPDLDKQTVAQYLHYWLEEVIAKQRTPKTYRSYEQQIRLHIVPSLGEIEVRKLRPQHVRALIGEKLESGLSAQSVRCLHAVLRSALATALDDDAALFNVAERAKPPKAEAKEVEPLTPEQAIAFLAAVRGDRLEALYTVGTALGMRQSEQLGLTWDYVDLDTGILRVEWALQRITRKTPNGSKTCEVHLVAPKRHSRRTIHLPQIAIEALRTHRIRQADEKLLCGSKWQTPVVKREGKSVTANFVFTTTIGTPLEGCNLTKRFQRVLEACGIPPHRFHDLRHTAATLLTVQGVHPKTIMKILGWSQMSMVDRYTHLVDEMRRDAAVKMDEILSRKQRQKSPWFPLWFPNQHSEE